MGYCSTVYIQLPLTKNYVLVQQKLFFFKPSLKLQTENISHGDNSAFYAFLYNPLKSANNGVFILPIYFLRAKNVFGPNKLSRENMFASRILNPSCSIFTCCVLFRFEEGPFHRRAWEEINWKFSSHLLSISGIKSLPLLLELLQIPWLAVLDCLIALHQCAEFPW